MYYLIDTTANIYLGRILTNHSMTIDEMLNLLDLGMDIEGEIITTDCESTGAYYDDLKMLTDTTPYTIRPEFWSNWGSHITSEEDAVVTLAEIADLAKEWNCDIDDLLRQVDKAD